MRHKHAYLKRAFVVGLSRMGVGGACRHLEGHMMWMGLIHHATIALIVAFCWVKLVMFAVSIAFLLSLLPLTSLLSFPPLAPVAFSIPEVLFPCSWRWSAGVGRGVALAFSLAPLGGQGGW